MSLSAEDAMAQIELTCIDAGMTYTIGASTYDTISFFVTQLGGIIEELRKQLGEQREQNHKTNLELARIIEQLEKLEW